MVGGGVPARAEEELTAEGASWPPVAAGLFDDLDDAQKAVAGIHERLTGLPWT